MEYEIVKSKRKTLSIEVKNDGRVVVKAPERMSSLAIKLFVNQRMDWIKKTRDKVMKRNQEQGPIEPFSDKEMAEIRKKARAMIMPLVDEYAEIMGVTYNRVAIRAQHSRWGSCSGEGNLNFNCLLALCPEGVMRYVVVHELCHRKHMNHSKAFWNEVEEYMPDYKEQRRWLKENGDLLIKKL